LTFDGVDDRVEIPDDPALDGMQRMTVAFWTRPSLNDGKSRGLVAKRVNTSSENAYGIFLYTGGKLFVDINGSDNRFPAPQRSRPGRGPMSPSSSTGPR